MKRVTLALATLSLSAVIFVGCGDQVVNSDPPPKPTRPSGTELNTRTTPDGRPINAPGGVTGGGTAGGTTGGAAGGATGSSTGGSLGGTR